MNDHDTTKATFDEMTAPVVAELVERATAAKVDPLPPDVADANREQIAATRGLVLGCSFMALAAIGIGALLALAKLLGWL